MLTHPCWVAVECCETESEPVRTLHVKLQCNSPHVFRAISSMGKTMDCLLGTSLSSACLTNCLAGLAMPTMMTRLGKF